MNTITNLNTFPIGNSLDGVNIITDEINTLSLLVDGTNSMLADLNMNNHIIKNMEAGVESLDAVNKSQLDLKADTTYVNTQDNLRVLKSGDTMTGILNMSSNKIINVANGTNNLDAVNRSQLNTKADTSYVNTQDALRLKRDGTDIMTGNLNMNSNKVINVANGTNNLDAINFSQLNNLSSALTQDINDLEFDVDSSLNLKVNKAGDTMTGTLNVNYGNAFVDIRATDENQDSILYLSTPYQNGLERRKTAIIADGLNTWNRANLHFCLNNTATHNNVSLSDSRMCILNSGNVGINTTTPSEKLDVNGNSILRGSLNMNSNKITSVADGIDDNDAVNKSQLDTKVNKSGDTMTGALNVSELTNSSNTNKQVFITNNNHGIWFNPRFVGGAWNPLVGADDKGLIFSNGTKNTGNLVIGPWSDSYNGVQINSNGQTTLNKNVSNSITQTTISTTTYITIQSSSTVYDYYNLTGGSPQFNLPSLTSTDTIMINKLIYFNVDGATELYFQGLGGAIEIDGITTTNAVFLTSSIGLLGTSTQGSYDLISYVPFPINTDNTDQLTIKSNLGTDTNTEFTGIRFLNTNTDAGFIRTETNRDHTDANMEFSVRQNNSITNPLTINNNIITNVPILRNAWNSGELMKTQIYGGSGLNKTVSSNNTWVEVLSLTFNADSNIDLNLTGIVINFNTSYYINGYDDDNAYSKVSDTTGTEQIIQITRQRYNNNNGGGTRSGTIFPIMCQYTPTQSLTNKTRTIKIYAKLNGTADTIYISNNDGESANNWHAEIKQIYN